ncbi:hypothetical protein PIB30_039896 [Stylosanthes scabra]|uniref:Uncharacterized protein n=1 Tax=Stylosanthes scabra TaxID=79078 RepID=A0ABU6YBT7_9FABA|nr:hypothetical protein [Stylosanthes scabra]
MGATEEGKMGSRIDRCPSISQIGGRTPGHVGMDNVATGAVAEAGTDPGSAVWVEYSASSEGVEKNGASTVVESNGASLVVVSSAGTAGEAEINSSDQVDRNNNGPSTADNGGMWCWGGVGYCMYD